MSTILLYRHGIIIVHPWSFPQRHRTLIDHSSSFIMLRPIVAVNDSASSSETGGMYLEQRATSCDGCIEAQMLKGFYDGDL
jgi:hypothetical protein